MAEPTYTRAEVEAALMTMWRAGWSARHMQTVPAPSGRHFTAAKIAAGEQLERMEALPDHPGRLEAVASILAAFQPGPESELPRILLDWLLSGECP